MTYTIRKDNAWNAALNVQSDMTGKYKIFNFMPATTGLGFDLQDQVAYSEYWTAPTVTIPIGSVDAVNSITFPQINSYVQPANPGSRTETYVATSYLTQTFDVIPKWLTLVAGFTFAKIETVTDTNIAVSSPYTATDLNGHDFLHRIAAVGHVTKDVTVYASESTTFSPNSGVTYLNTPLPPVLGKSDEVGVKTGFLDGKISVSAAAYKMTLTNQTILAAYPALNIAGLNYYIPIGTTTSHGWDASMSIAPLPGLQVVGTAYVGTVRDQNNSSITGTLENSWSLFTRYDFDHNDYASFLHAFGVGGGATKSGGKWFTMSGLVLPGGAPLPTNASGLSVFKLHQDVLLNMFIDYKYNKHLTLRVDCENVLDKHFPIGAQGVGLVDSVDPRTFSFEATYKF
jgi:outer membrane receptor for ferric coprogen and ferric-rhodotorulic acid